MSVSESIAMRTPGSGASALAFKVYITASDLKESAVLQALRRYHCGEIEDIVIERFDGLDTQEVIHIHRNSSHHECGTHPTLLLILDSTDLEERGALLVSLNEYHGFDDALRLIPDLSIDFMSSLSAVGEGWYTLRLDVPDEKTAATPFRWFALYKASSQRSIFNEAVVAMNRGVQEAGVAGPDRESSAEELPRIYTAARGRQRSLDQIIDDHPFFAETRGLDPDHFAVIDGEYRKKGALIVQVSPERDSFRCRGNVAGELLRWIFINFMTWDEAKAIAWGL
ncbi:hypothetical protein E4U56_004005 [Claviceps arundinis]|uniref:Uncharacterized protein n=1 Tax=Claviceps arundinis TaxID=1623583 RepID=A0A9P7MZU9_9HYPO|nr:hypothetical protein E4U56_004005 [Claviceps arundinis]